MAARSLSNQPSQRSSPTANAVAPHSLLPFSMEGNAFPPQKVWRFSFLWCWCDSDNSQEITPGASSDRPSPAQWVSSPEREISRREHKQRVSTSSIRKGLSRKDLVASEGGTKTRNIEDSCFYWKKPCKTKKPMVERNWEQGTHKIGRGSSLLAQREATEANIISTQLLMNTLGVSIHIYT